MNVELGTLARVTILLLGTTLLATSLRKVSAATRHSIWVIGLSAALILPIASWVLPAINLPVFTEPATRDAGVEIHSSSTVGERALMLAPSAQPQAGRRTERASLTEP